MKPLLQLLKRPLLFVAGFSFFVNLLLLAPALFMLQVFDRVLTSQSQETLLVLLLGVAVALGLMAVLDYLRGRLQGVAGKLIAEALSPTVAELMLARTARRAERAPSEGLRDVAALRSLFSAQGLLALFDVPGRFVYVAVIWLAHPLLGAAAAAAAVADARPCGGERPLHAPRHREPCSRRPAGATRYLEASMQNAEVAQVAGHGRRADRALARNSTLASTALQGPTAAQDSRHGGAHAHTRQAVQVVMLGARRLARHHRRRPRRASWWPPPSCWVARWRRSSRWSGAGACWPRGGRLRAPARAAGRRRAQPRAHALPAPSGRLHAQGLVFRPPQSERMILAGVSLSLEPGESLAIIGPSGAGKSTLVRLLTGLWKPNAGAVRLDGVDLAQWPREALGPWLGYVPQDVELFAGTVADNIARLGEVDADAVVAGGAARRRARADPGAAARATTRVVDTARRDAVAGPAPAHRAGARALRRPEAAGAGRAQLQPRRSRRTGAGRGAEGAARAESP